MPWTSEPRDFNIMAVLIAFEHLVSCWWHKVAEYLQLKLEELHPSCKVRMHQVDSDDSDALQSNGESIEEEEEGEEDIIELELVCKDKVY